MEEDKKREEKVFNRWLVLIGALLAQLALGSIYAWSVFANILQTESWWNNATEPQIVFSLGLASFATVIVIAGKLQDKRGPRLIATIGGIVLGGGYIIAGLSNGSFLTVAMSIGILGGAGIGLGYVCPIAACVKWFPDKRGLITGIAVAGFGAGAWIFARLGEMFIESGGVLQAFLYLGVIYLVMIVLGAQLLRNPPKGWKPKGWEETTKDEKHAKEINFEWKEMLKTRQFILLWLMFFSGAVAGLMVIGNLKPFGIYSGLDAVAAGTAVGILALFNGAGRIVWGWASDRLGRSRAMMGMLGLQGLMMLAIGLANFGSTGLTLTIAAAWIGFNFGGNFALFPSATADFFGTKNLGVNYGLVFTSYAVAGIIGPILGGRIFDMTGSYLWAFIPTGVVCLIGALLGLLLSSPRK